MRQEVAKRLDRQLAFETVSKNLLAVISGLLILAGLIFWVSDVPVSRQVLDARYVRWTVGQSDYGQPMPRVFIDLPNGNTVMVTASASWRPPEPGSPIRIEEQTLRWYGKRYSLTP